MKNRFEVRGNTTVIFVNYKEEIVEVLVSTSDLPKLMEFPYKWGYNCGYIQAATYFEGKHKQKSIKLHRFLTEAPDGLVVDHINGDKLDNRKENLRVVTSRINNQNRKNSKNVYLDKRSNNYYASVRTKERIYYSRYFKTFEEARKEAIKMRSAILEGSIERYKNPKPFDCLKLQNKREPRATNKTSGIRYISYQSRIEKWRVKVKTIRYGDFDTLEEAKTVLEKVLKNLKIA
ncbi:AP2 domain protein [compost metagenome]